MNKTDLVGVVAERLAAGTLGKTDGRVAVRKVAEEAVAAVTEAIKDEVAAGGKVTLVNFGTFYGHRRGPRRVFNPAKGRHVVAAETRKPRWRPGKDFEARVAEAGV